MKKVKYKVSWDLNKPQEREGELYELFIDYPYSFRRLSNEEKLIPSFEVLRGIALQGGGSGGMSPGATWEPFELTRQDYEDLILKLMNLDYEKEKKAHPYLPEKFIIDQELNKHNEGYKSWQKRFVLKYRGVNAQHQFNLKNEYPVYYLEDKIGVIYITGGGRDSKWRGKFNRTNKFTWKDFDKLDNLDQSYRYRLIEAELNWYKRKNPDMTMEIVDEWDIKQKIIEFSISEDYDVAFKPNFQKIEPYIKT